MGALEISVKNLGLSDYHLTWQAMQDFTQSRNESSKDELWIVEHPSVYTLGRNGKEEHILNETKIPIVKVDRGGQVTYHGPGQLVVYLLIDLPRRQLGIRQLVTLIEESIIHLLAEYHIKAESNKEAPGVYIEGRKIAALGLRVSKGKTTHGLSLNIDMDMNPYKNINPCGYTDMEVIQCVDLGVKDNVQVIGDKLTSQLINALTRL
ncbi:MAG: lipoyl(octanoyl) transferase LipB [Cocleimonas sp.]